MALQINFCLAFSCSSFSAVFFINFDVRFASFDKINFNILLCCTTMINNPLNCDAFFLNALCLGYRLKTTKDARNFWDIYIMILVTILNSPELYKDVFLTVFKRYGASVFKREICSLQAPTILLLNLAS